MELCMNRPGFLHSHVSGQIRVQSVGEVVVRMRPVKVYHSNLTRRVNACVRSPGQDDRASSPSQFAQGFFEFALHSSGFCLSLASKKGGAVVGKSQLVTCHCSSDSTKCPAGQSPRRTAEAVPTLFFNQFQNHHLS